MNIMKIKKKKRGTFFERVYLKFFENAVRLMLPLLNSLFFRTSRSFRTFQNVCAFSDIEKILDLATEFVQWDAIEGDYLEFGVYGGRSFATACHFAQSKGIESMRFYAFDSFEGLPEIKGADKNDYCRYTKGWYSCDQAKFSQNLLKRGAELEKVTIVPGWFDQTLVPETKSKLQIKKAAIIFVDCDLYESTTLVLDFITDYIQDGTILIFDDWFCFRADPDKGEQGAFASWLKKTPHIKAQEYRRWGYHGNSFILRRLSGPISLC